MWKIGVKVRLIASCDPPELADDLHVVGTEGVVIGGGRYFEDYEASYDVICFFPAYGEYCAWSWQLEPIVDEKQREQTEQLEVVE